MLWVWSLCSWENDKTYSSFLTQWNWSLCNSPLPQEKDLWQHISVGLAACLRNQPCDKMLAELCILVPWIGWKFFWNRSVKQNINWQSISYKINIHLCLFYILFFNGYQVPIFIMDFIKSFTVSTIWGRTAQKCGCFFITFYSVLHIKLLGGNSILSPVYIGRIINR